MNEHTPVNSQEEQEVARLLRAAGRREELPDELKQRWEATLRVEIANVLQRRRQRKLRSLTAIAAGVVLIVAVLLFTKDPTIESKNMWIVSVSGSSWTLYGDGEARVSSPGQILDSGSILSTDIDSRLAFDWFGYDLRLNSSTRVELSAENVVLLEGELYVNGDSNSPTTGIRVVTRLAEITDIGTQFTVRVDAEGVTSSVRLGSILVSAGDQEFTAEADSGMARQLSINEKLQVVETRVDRNWDWIYSVSPEFETENRSVYDFLLWSVAESGRELQFASDGVEVSARLAILNAADISSLDPEQAMNAVLATTRFKADRAVPGVLLIQRRN